MLCFHVFLAVKATLRPCINCLQAALNKAAEQTEEDAEDMLRHVARASTPLFSAHGLH